MSLPLVTIGVPAYNEGAYIREALESLLKQTYQNLEIVVADNGSTDDTAKVCQEFAAKDPRIVHVRHPRNIGQNANFNHLPRVASGTYFCWASAHDLLDSNFVERCIETLEARPEAVLAYPRTVYMAQDGTIIGEKKRNPFDISAMPAPARFREVMWRVDCNVVYGMWRTAAMLDSNLFQLVPAPDRVFLSEMAIKGSFVKTDTAKYYRANRGSVPQTEIQKRHRLMSYIWPHKTFGDTELSGNYFYAPTFRAFERAVLDANFPLPVRWRCLISVWLCGAIKSHMFPGADALSVFVKAALPAPLLRAAMRKMQ